MTVDQYLEKVGGMAINICDALRGEVVKMGFAVDRIDPDVKRAEYTLSKDPASGLDSLIGIWRDEQGHKQGEILFHADGTFFAEYDVISEHPKKPRWFVEGVTAWGKEGQVKAEPKLLPSIE